MEAQNGMTAPQEGAAAADFARQTRAFKNGANWFYWIAGLSVVNTLISLFQGTIGFIFGLGATRIVDAIAAAIMIDAGQPILLVQVIALIISVFFAGICLLFGWLAKRGQGWAFLVGMFLYTLDGLLLLLIQDWLSLAFHGFALVCMFQGYTALRKLRTMVPPTAPQQVEFGPGA